MGDYTILRGNSSEGPFFEIITWYEAIPAKYKVIQANQLH
jgi:hypothetical protein